MKTDGQGSKNEYVLATSCFNLSKVLDFNNFMTTGDYFQYFNVFIQTRLKFLNISIKIYVDKHNNK
jgi:hypothetical protein